MSAPEGDAARQVAELTGLTHSEALSLLRRNGGQPDAAVAAFFDGEQQSGGAAAEQQASNGGGEAREERDLLGIDRIMNNAKKGSEEGEESSPSSFRGDL